jgi:hypothetical protein
VKVSLSLRVMSRRTNLKSHSICQVQSVMRHFKASNVLPADIQKQIFEVYGERAMSEGNMRKWCRLSKKGRKLCDGMSPTIQAHYSKNSSVNFQVSSMQSPPSTRWLSLVSAPQSFFGLPESEEWPGDKRHRAWHSEMMCGKYFQKRDTKAGLMTWQVP